MLIIEGLLYCVKDVFAVLSIIYILKTVFLEQKRETKGEKFICFLLPAVYTFFSLLLLPEEFSYTYELLDAVSNFFYIAVVFILFKKLSVFRTLAVIFIYVFTVDMIWSFVADIFMNSIIAECVFNSLLYGGVFFAVRAFSNKDDINVLAGAFKEIPKWMIVALLLFELTCYYKEFGISAVWYDFLYAVSAIMIFVCILCLIFRIFRLIYTQNSILQRLNDLIINSENSARSDEALRSFRHDYKNHIIVINSMFEQGDVDGAKEYFEKLKSDTVGTIDSFSTGNTVVNALLNVKKTQLEKYNAFIDFSGMIPDKGIDPKDMCVCVGNLIDNAAEACALIKGNEKKTVLVCGNVNKNALLLTVKNPFDDKGRTDDGLFKTSKKDKKNHGIGLKNVRETAEKYGGELLLSSENGIFTARLILYFND